MRLGQKYRNQVLPYREVVKFTDYVSGFIFVRGKERTTMRTKTFNGVPDVFGQHIDICERLPRVSSFTSEVRGVNRKLLQV